MITCPEPDCLETVLNSVTQLIGDMAIPLNGISRKLNTSGGSTLVGNQCVFYSGSDLRIKEWELNGR